VLYALHTLGMLNEIDYRNGFSFSILVTLLSILEMGTCALAAVSKERLLALLILTTHSSRPSSPTLSAAE